MIAPADLLMEGIEPPPVSLELLRFEAELFGEMTLAEIADGCRLCFWAGSEDDPVDIAIICDDKTKAIAPVSLCETCKSGVKPATLKRIVKGLRPSEFICASAIDAWGGVLLGDPAAPLRAKVRAVGHWMPEGWD